MFGNSEEEDALHSMLPIFYFWGGFFYDFGFCCLVSQKLFSVSLTCCSSCCAFSLGGTVPKGASYTLDFQPLS